MFDIGSASSTLTLYLDTSLVSTPGAGTQAFAFSDLLNENNSNIDASALEASLSNAGALSIDYFIYEVITTLGFTGTDPINCYVGVETDFQLTSTISSTPLGDLTIRVDPFTDTPDDRVITPYQYFLTFPSQTSTLSLVQDLTITTTEAPGVSGQYWSARAVNTIPANYTGPSLDNPPAQGLTVVLNIGETLDKATITNPPATYPIFGVSTDIDIEMELNTAPVGENLTVILDYSGEVGPLSFGVPQTKTFTIGSTETWIPTVLTIADPNAFGAFTQRFAITPQAPLPTNYNISFPANTPPFSVYYNVSSLAAQIKMQDLTICPATQDALWEATITLSQAPTGGDITTRFEPQLGTQTDNWEYPDDIVWSVGTANLSRTVSYKLIDSGAYETNKRHQFVWSIYSTGVQCDGEALSLDVVYLDIEPSSTIEYGV